MTEIYVKVEPGSDKLDIEPGFMPKIYLTEEAEKGRANKQLKDELENIIGERPGIISGSKSRRKKLKISMDRKTFQTKIKEGREKWEK